MAKKEIAGYVKLQINGGQANPAPPVGPALGAKGVNIMEFCKQFNARTQDKAGTVIPVIITVFTDKSFEFVTKTTALACQNFMMALVSQGYDCCPMEGFDHRRVKKILNLNNKCHVVMVLGVGKADTKGIYGERFIIDDDLVIKII